jgi:hypothetical protein
MQSIPVNLAVSIQRLWVPRSDALPVLEESAFRPDAPSMAATKERK